MGIMNIRSLPRIGYVGIRQLKWGYSMGRYIPAVFWEASRFLAHFRIVSNIKTCLRRFLDSKVAVGIGAVFAVEELTLAIRFLVVICDCEARAGVDNEDPSWAGGATGVKPLSLRSLPNHRDL
jgi:hypothetical protein